MSSLKGTNLFEVVPGHRFAGRDASVFGECSLHQLTAVVCSPGVGVAEGRHSHAKFEPAVHAGDVQVVQIGDGPAQSR